MGLFSALALRFIVLKESGEYQGEKRREVTESNKLHAKVCGYGERETGFRLYRIELEADRNYRITRYGD